jgi:DNA-binding transcriptional LysR family regulator
MDLNQISVFLQVVEAQSFTAAGKALGVPKSSVSRSVAKLEQELGVELLKRTTRSLALTDAGQRYLTRAREAIQMLSEAREEAVESDAEPRGTVRLTLPPDPTGVLHSEPLARFIKLYPNIHVELVITPRQVDLVEEGVDLALRATRLTDSSLVGKRIGAVPTVLAAAPSYLEARGTPRRLADLARHDCVLHRAAQGKQRWTLSGKNGDESVLVRGPINVDDVPYVFNFCCQGLGIGLLPELLTESAIREGKLVRVLPNYSQQGIVLYLVHPATRRLPRRVILLRDFLYEAMRGQLQRCTEEFSRGRK